MGWNRPAGVGRADDLNSPEPRLSPDMYYEVVTFIDYHTNVLQQKFK